MLSALGKTVLIANPTSRSGRGEAAAFTAAKLLAPGTAPTSSFELLLTRAPGDGKEMAADLVDCDTLIALGGDGLIHELVCGLMELPVEKRPRFGVIAMGSGNDFARTIGADLNKPERAIEQLIAGEERPYDLGVIDRDSSQRTYVAETLSFGLDAAIALDTTDRRTEGTSQHGAALFATSGLKIMSQAHSGWDYELKYIDSAGKEHEVQGTEIILALQVGPTYGGGFPVTPEAVPNDGLLDLCRNTKLPSVPTTLALFGRARLGLHAKSKYLAFDRFSHLEVNFPRAQPPAQVDGELLEGAHHTVDVIPKALRVIWP